MAAIYYFPQGQILVFWDPAQLPNSVQILQKVANEHHVRLEDMFGREVTESNYALLRTVLNLTPSQLSPVSPRREAVNKALLLAMKSTWATKRVSAIYSLELNGLRGFQIGDPARDEHVEVRCFDSSDRELKFSFLLKDGAPAKLKQSEINRVVQTLHPAKTTAGAGASARWDRCGRTGSAAQTKS